MCTDGGLSYKSASACALIQKGKRKMKFLTNGLHNIFSRTHKQQQAWRGVLSDSITVISECIYMQNSMLCSVLVCNCATSCMCKTVQTLVFPDQLVNHIWGKNLDSFPPSFSAASTSPHVCDSSLLCLSALLKKKIKKKTEVSFSCPQANFSLVLEQRKGMSYFALITLVSARLYFRSILRMEWGTKGRGGD